MYIVPLSVLWDNSHLRLQDRFCCPSQDSVMSKIMRICLSFLLDMFGDFCFWSISYWRQKMPLFSKKDLAVLQVPDQQVGMISWENWSSKTRLRSRCNPQSYLGGAFYSIQVHGGARSQALHLGRRGCIDATVQEPVCNYRNSVISVAGLLGPDLGSCVIGV